MGENLILILTLRANIVVCFLVGASDWAKKCHRHRSGSVEPAWDLLDLGVVWGLVRWRVTWQLLIRSNGCAVL